jgi:GNAT superfamily N-acetyltransferase
MQFQTSPQVTLRTVTGRDIQTLVALNRAAYPDLAEQEVVFSPEHLRAHAEVFPRGQILAEIDGVVVGAIATLILRREMDPLAPHTWYQATGDGFFTTHDPAGTTLYLADVYVDRAAWGRGVGTALYGALRSLCRDLGLARIVAGGRLWGYHAVAHQRTPEAYIEDVVLGVRIDRVLGSQLKAGFVVRGVLPSYLPDPKSCDFASLLEWANPDLASPRAATEATLASAQRGAAAGRLDSDSTARTVQRRSVSK